MTRDEFIRDVTTFDELKDFCYENDCCECDRVKSEETFNDWIEENLVEWARNETWQDLYSILNRLDGQSGYGWYVWDDYYSEYRPAEDSDFDDYKENVLDWADRNDVWDGENDDDTEEVDDPWADEEDRNEPEPEPVDPEDIEPTPEEDCTFTGLFDSSLNCIRVIREEAVERERQQSEAYANFMSTVIHVKTGG